MAKAEQTSTEQATWAEKPRTDAHPAWLHTMVQNRIFEVSMATAGQRATTHTLPEWLQRIADEQH